MKCVVVGGGVIGASIAWHLARDGHAVTLFERDRLGSGTTWHSAGNISWKPLPDHDQSVLYAYETIPRVEAESGQMTGWLRTGRTYIARSQATLSECERFDSVARDRGIPARWLEHEEARQLNPLLDPTPAGGIWLCSLSGRLAPADLTAAYAIAARRAGAQVIEGAAVQQLCRAGDRITGVQTTSDSFVAADLVVLAAGLWSRNLASERRGGVTAMAGSALLCDFSTLLRSCPARCRHSCRPTISVMAARRLGNSSSARSMRTLSRSNRKSCRSRSPSHCFLLSGEKVRTLCRACRRAVSGAQYGRRANLHQWPRDVHA